MIRAAQTSAARLELYDCSNPEKPSPQINCMLFMAKPLATVQVVLCPILGAFFGPMSTAVADQFAARARSTGLGAAYNGAVMVFGGFAQFFVTWLIEVTGSPVAPAFYVMFGAATAVIAAFFLLDRARDVRLPTFEAETTNVAVA